MKKTGKDSMIITENSGDIRIKEEYERINCFFEDLKENEKNIIMPLIQNAAFMRVTLDDLQEIIANQGPVEQYMNGANQYGMKQSAALQSYNALVKNYAAIIKTLFGLLPPEKRATASLVEARTKVLSESEKHRKAEEAEEHQRRINQERDRAAEMQRKQRELEESRKNYS